jgi:protein-tyrosine phosphatase
MIGSAPPPGEDLKNICDVVVLCAVEYQLPQSEFPECELISIPLHDDLVPLNPTEIERIRECVDDVGRALLSNKQCLITCFMGLNRSALITALTMCKYLGCTPNEAIARVRSCRGSHALSNPYFVNIIKTGKF